jgi:hypothetical protein
MATAVHPITTAIEATQRSVARNLRVDAIQKINISQKNTPRKTQPSFQAITDLRSRPTNADANRNTFRRDASQLTRSIVTPDRIGAEE